MREQRNDGMIVLGVDIRLKMIVLNRSIKNMYSLKKVTVKNNKQIYLAHVQEKYNKA